MWSGYLNQKSESFNVVLRKRLSGCKCNRLAKQLVEVLNLSFTACFKKTEIAASHLNKGDEGLVWKRKRFRKIIRQNG